MKHLSEITWLATRNAKRETPLYKAVQPFGIRCPIDIVSNEEGSALSPRGSFETGSYNVLNLSSFVRNKHCFHGQAGISGIP
jgi:hypothetical protein